MDVQQYWQDVKQKAEEISKKCPDGIVFLTSRHNRERNTTAGVVCTAHISHAAELLTNNTHDLATEDEIRAYKDRQGEIKKGILSTEISKRQQYVMVVDKGEAEAKGYTSGSAEEPTKTKQVAAK
jgi:hypothetical protein